MSEIFGVVVAIFFIAGSFFFGMAVGTKSTNDGWQKQTIERGYARYNETTGAWEWK